MTVLVVRQSQSEWFPFLLLLCSVFFSLPNDDVSAAELEFSALLKWRTDGKTSRAQLFVKNDRYRV